MSVMSLVKLSPSKLWREVKDRVERHKTCDTNLLFLFSLLSRDRHWIAPLFDWRSPWQRVSSSRCALLSDKTISWRWSMPMHVQEEHACTWRLKEGREGGVRRETNKGSTKSTRSLVSEKGF